MISKKQSINKNIKNSNSKKLKRKKNYRKSRKQFKLRGGTYLNNNPNKIKILHPLSQFVLKRLEDKCIVCLNANNVDSIEYDDIFTMTFFNKLIDMLNFSFLREREYHISRGSYSPGHKHNLNTIKANVHNSKFETLILTKGNLEPLSFLYIEKNENDFDKIWTVCTDNEYRGQGLSSLLLNFMIVRQLNQKRKDMMLEVYNDHIINRNENDVLQKQIMSLFNSKGFNHTEVADLEEHSQNNLLSNSGDTKIMVFKPEEWLQKNENEESNLNMNGRSCL
jgi:GNAT superfamily N-acetyltransferase